MSITQITEDWRTPRCSEWCRAVLVWNPEARATSRRPWHDVDGHEAAVREEIERARTDLRFGPLVVSPATMRAWVHDRVVVLTRTETLILVYLAERHGRLVPYQELIRAVWGSDYEILLPSRAADYHHVVRVNLARLRRKLKGAGGLIRTHTGLGLSMPRAEAMSADGLPSETPVFRLWGRPLQQRLIEFLLGRSGEWVSVERLVRHARAERAQRRPADVLEALDGLAAVVEGLDFEVQGGAVVAARVTTPTLVLRRVPPARKVYGR